MKSSKLPFSYSRDRIVDDVVHVAEQRLLDAYVEIDRVANSEKFQQTLQLKFATKEERIQQMDEIKEKQFKLTAEQLMTKIASNTEFGLDEEMKSLDLCIATKEFAEKALKAVLPAYKEASKKPVDQENIQYFRTNVRAALSFIANSTIVPKNKP